MDWPVSSPPGGQWTFSRSQQEANSSPGPSSSPSTSRYQHHIPSSPSPLRSSDPVKPVTPGAFVSPRQSKLYPLADSTADVVEQRRLGFFQRQAMSATPSTSASSSMLPPLLQPGPSSARSSASARRERFKKPPSSSSPSTGLIAGDDVSASLYRQRFRERCQAVMARDRGRKKAIARSRGRDIDAELGISSDEEDEGGGASGSRGIQMGRRGQQQKVILNSDDLSSSDREEDHNAWQEEDEELVRRVMLAEYRRLLLAQEHSGQRELGWIGADEAAWLEEELQKEDAQRGERTMTSASSQDQQLQPPPDLLDEEAALYEQYCYALEQQQQGQQSSNAAQMTAEDEFDDGSDIDLAFADETLLAPWQPPIPQDHLRSDDANMDLS